MKGEISIVKDGDELRIYFMNKLIKTDYKVADVYSDGRLCFYW